MAKQLKCKIPGVNIQTKAARLSPHAQRPRTPRLLLSRVIPVLRVDGTQSWGMGGGLRIAGRWNQTIHSVLHGESSIVLAQDSSSFHELPFKLPYDLFDPRFIYAMRTESAYRFAGAMSRYVDEDVFT